MTKIDSKIDVYDPRNGEEFLFGSVGGRTFSSLKENLIVVFCSERYAPFTKNGHILSKLVSMSLKSFEGIGFFSVYAVPKVIEDALSENAIWSGSSALEYFDLGDEEISKRLELFEKISFGGCQIGICKSRFPSHDVVSGMDLDDFVLFARPSNLQCLFSYSESGVAMLITRFYQGIDEQLQELADAAGQ